MEKLNKPPLDKHLIRANACIIGASMSFGSMVSLLFVVSKSVLVPNFTVITLILLMSSIFIFFLLSFFKELARFHLENKKV